MVLGLLKWLKETSFFERKKEIIIKTWTLHERKVHIKERGRVYEFSDKGEVDIKNFWEWKEIFFKVESWYKDDLFVVFTKLHDILWNAKDDISVLKKERSDYIFLSMEYHIYWLLKSSCFEFFGDGKYELFWAKKLMER